MKYRMAIIMACGLAVLDCGSNPAPTSDQQVSTVRTYTGSASVGDFFSISLDPTAQTLTYTDYSNNESGTVAYTANANGTYTLSDPTGNLVQAYEIPNYAMLIQATMAGPNKNTLALVTAVQSSQVSAATFANKKFNYMQFRTSEGGASIGVAAMDAQSNVTTSSYWPFGEQNQEGAFTSSSFLSSSFQEGSSGNFFEIPSTEGPPDYVFGTPSGIFAVDNPNGTILGLQQAAAKDFLATYGGTYTAMYYRKVNASYGTGNVETGTPSMGIASLVIGPTGQLTLTDSSNNVLAQGTLAAVADTSYLYNGGPNELPDPCFGLFTFRVTTATTHQDVFVTFLNQAVLFFSYKSLPSVAGNNFYNYSYGVALK